MCVYAIAVVESSCADALCIGHVGPDLMALMAVMWVLWNPSPRAFVAAGFIGLASDLFSPGRLGTATATFLVMGYLLVRLKGKFPVQKVVWQIPAVSIAVGLSAATLGLACWLFGETSTELDTLLVRAAGVGIYTGGMALPCAMTLSWITKPTPFAV
jgi:rod shape-determining protein MreD